MSRVETLEPQTRRRHLVEHRRLDVGMPVVAGFFPSVVVAHEQDNIRKGGGKRVAPANAEESQETKCDSHEGNAYLDQLLCATFDRRPSQVLTDDVENDDPVVPADGRSYSW